MPAVALATPLGLSIAAIAAVTVIVPDAVEPSAIKIFRADWRWRDSPGNYDGNGTEFDAL